MLCLSRRTQNNIHVSPPYSDHPRFWWSDVHADLHALPSVHKLVPVSPTASVVERAALLGLRVKGEAALAGLAGALLTGQQAEPRGLEAVLWHGGICGGMLLVNGSLHCVGFRDGVQWDIYFFGLYRRLYFRRVGRLWATNFCSWFFGRFCRLLASGLALRHSLEVVGIAEAAAVIELPAFLGDTVKEVACHKSPAGARGLLQMTGTLVGRHHAGLPAGLHGVEVVGVPAAAPVLEGAAMAHVHVEEEALLYRLAGSRVLLHHTQLEEDEGPGPRLLFCGFMVRAVESWGRGAAGDAQRTEDAQSNPAVEQQRGGHAGRLDEG